jgi:hypothetical protein
MVDEVGHQAEEDPVGQGPHGPADAFGAGDALPGAPAIQRQQERRVDPRLEVDGIRPIGMGSTSTLGPTAKERRHRALHTGERTSAMSRM